MSQSQMDVLIYGGGMAGALLAKTLSPQYRIALVDPNEYFEVPMAAPRSLVQPEFADRAIVPFANALPSVQHIRGALTELRTDGGVVRLQGGQDALIQGRITVLATGSVFSNALMRAVGGASVDERKAFYQNYRNRLADSQRIIIVGGGPVGVEVAGDTIQKKPSPCWRRANACWRAPPKVLRNTPLNFLRNTA